MSLAAQIAAALGQGKEARNGDGWMTLCPVHGDDNPSLSVKDTNNKEGAPDIILECFAGCGFREVKDQLRGMGLLPEWQPKNKPSRTRQKNKEKPSEPEAEKDSFVWKKSKKDNEQIGKYFTNRAIIFNSENFPVPPALKWNSYKDKKTGDQVKMVVAAASQPDDRSVKAVQRLFIDTDDYTKTGAKMLDNVRGRGVYFYRKWPMVELVIGEGIETTLSVMQVTGKNGVAALSTSGMKNINLPSKTETLYILVDSDTSFAGQKAAYELAKKFEKEGGQAFIVSPDDSCFTDSPRKLDFNDLLMEDNSGGLIKERITAAVLFKELDWEPPAEDDNKENGDDDGYYPSETLAALKDLNKKYAAVLLGGDFRVIREGFDKTEKKHTLSFIKVSSFYNYFANIKYPVKAGEKGELRYKQMAKVWMDWRDRRTYNDVIFSPSDNVSKQPYNLFRGFPLTPKKGDWSLMRWHIENVICAGDKEIFKYVLAWMARAVQEPGGERPGVAIVLKGGKGIGKGFFANYFGQIFGEAFLPISDSDNFTGRFNMHLSKSLVVFLDEAVWGGNKKAEGKLKSIITEPTVLFEPKGIDSIAMRNYMNIIIASNEDWVVPATGDERRFLVLHPDDCKRMDTDYFGKLAHERDNGGCEAMMHDLMSHDYSGVNLRKAPHTEALGGQVEKSLCSVHSFWHSVLARGFLLSEKETGAPRKSSGANSVTTDDEWPDYVWKYEIYEEFLIWCRKRGERYIPSEIGFWMKMWEVWPCGKPALRIRRKDEKGGLVDKIMIYTIQEMRAAFTATTKIRFDDMESIEEFDGQF